MLMTTIRKKMHIGLWAIVIMFAASIFLYFGMGGPGSANKAGNQDKKESRYIAEINGKKIPLEIFNYEYKEMKGFYDTQGVPDLDSYPMQMRLKADTLRRLLMQEVFLQEAERRDVKLNSAELARKIKQERDRMVGPAPEAAAGVKGRFNAYNADNKKNKEFKQRLAYLGVSYKTYRQIMQRRALAEKVMQDMAKEMGDKQQREVEENALKAWKKIKSGESFEKLAAQFTEDDATKESSGLLGWKKRGDLEDAIAASAFKMKPGAYSRPIKTSLGFQIIKVDDVKAATGPEYEAFRTNYVQQLMADDPKARPPAERDLQKMFESVLLRHILFKIKDGTTLASEWANEKIDKDKVKYTVLDKELRAYMALQKAATKGGMKQAALEKVLKMYEAALKDDPGNNNLYYQIGSLYEQMNRLLNEKLDKGGKDKKDKKEVDPYEKDGSGDDGKKKTVTYLDSALESYMKSYEMSQESGDMTNADMVMGIARISKTLSESTKDKKKAAKHRKRAKQFYVYAIDYAYDNIYVLKQIEPELEKYKDKKNLKEVRQLIADIEQQYMEEQGLNQFQVDEGDAKSPPQTVKVVPPAEQKGENKEGTPAPEQKAPAETKSGP